MALRFGFISHAAWGHIDFGGLSFARTAVELQRRGHEVVWLLAGESSDWRDRTAVAAHLTQSGIVVQPLAGTLSHYSAHAEEAIPALARQLSSFDACAIDRLAAVAGDAADRAGIPWAAVGTTGSRWRLSPEGVMPAPEAENSFWAASPYLNLSFFSRAFYPSECAGANAHFVGCAGHDEAATERRLVLVTLGTSFPQGRRARLLQMLEAARERVGGAWRFLVGADWQPYGQAFAGARLAIGHGGNAFLWQAIHEGIPAIAVSGGVGDQTFGARAIRRLGVGWALDSDVGATAESIAAAVDRLLGDRATVARAQRQSAVLHSGGGVAAAAALLERLARERRALPACASAPCCCREAT